MNDGSTRALDRLCGLEEKLFVRVSSGAGGAEPMELFGHSMAVDPCRRTLFPPPSFLGAHTTRKRLAAALSCLAAQTLRGRSFTTQCGS